MSEERWLRELGEEAKEQKEREAAWLDERWDRLSAGTLSTEEEEALRALAATSEQAEEAYELFQPFSPEVEARILSALGAREKAARLEAEGTEGESAPSSPSTRNAPPDPGGRRVLPFPGRRFRVVGGLSAAVAAAAAALVVIVLRAPAASRGAFPNYAEAPLEGFARSERGGAPGPGEIPAYHGGSGLQLILTPPTRVEGVKADCYFVRPDAPSEPETCSPGVLEVDERTGRIEVKGTVGRDLPLAAGDWRLCVVAGFADRFPRSPAELCRAESARAPAGAAYRIFQRRLRIDAPDS